MKYFKKFSLVAAALAAVFVSGPACADKVSDYPSALPLTGTEIIPVIRAGQSGGFKITPDDLIDFLGDGLQPADDELSALAGVSSAADKCPYFTGAAAASVFTCGPYGRGFVGAADAAAARALLGLSAVAASGLYADLSGRPTLLSQFTNDASFITAAGAPVLSVNGATGAVTLTTATIADSTDKRYVTDAQRTVIGNTSGTNTGDQVLSDATLSTSDITTNNVSASKHGFVPKLPNDATKCLNGVGAFDDCGGDRRAFGPTICQIGDSEISNGNDAATTISANESAGILAQFQFLLGQPFYYPFANSGSTFTSGNFGHGGDTIADVLARVSAVTAGSYHTCLLLVGTNDLTAHTAYATMTSGMTTLLQTLTDDGINVIVFLIGPRNDSSWTGMSAGNITIERGKMLRFNDWLRRWPAANDNTKVFVADETGCMVDPTSATGDPRSDVTVDGLHPSPIGADCYAQAAIRAIGGQVPRTAAAFHSQADVYDATNNPTGNLIPNGLFTGTGGSVGTGQSGSVADGWTVTRSGGTGCTTVWSKGTTDLDGVSPGTYQQAVVTCNGSGSGEESTTLSLTPTLSSGFAAGDAVYGGADVEIVSLTGNVVSLNPDIFATVSATNYFAKDMDKYASPYNMPQRRRMGRWLTPDLIIPSGATALNMRIVLRCQNTSPGCTATFRVNRAFMKKRI